jgi:hypothetical protein
MVPVNAQAAMDKIFDLSVAGGDADLAGSSRACPTSQTPREQDVCVKAYLSQMRYTTRTLCLPLFVS